MNTVIDEIRQAIDQSNLPAPRKRRILRRLNRPRFAEMVSEMALIEAWYEGIVSLADFEAADLEADEPAPVPRIDWEAFGKFLRESLLPFLIALIEAFSRLSALAAAGKPVAA